MRPITISLLLGAALLAAASPLAADVDINVNIGLPAVVLDSEPELAVVPGTYIYFIFGRSDDFFFYRGYWWRPHGKKWFRATGYNGPWVVIAPRLVPAPFFRLPAGWRTLPPGHARLKWNEVRNGWKQWEKEKRWDAKPAKGDGPKPAKGGSGKPHGKRK